MDTQVLHVTTLTIFSGGGEITDFLEYLFPLSFQWNVFRCNGFIKTILGWIEHLFLIQSATLSFD